MAFRIDKESPQGGLSIECGKMLFLNNLLGGDTVVGDNAHEVNTVGQFGHVDAVHVLFGHHGAAVDVKHADFLHAIGSNVEDAGGGVGVEGDAAVVRLL